MPTWGADLSGIDFDNIKYFVRSTEKQAASWEDLPEDIKNTYDRLGIPEAEKQRLVAGVAAQYESEVVYHQINEELEEQGVIFVDTDTGAARAPRAVQGVLRHRHPGRRQQVRRAEHRGVVGRLVHLRAQGRPRRDPAAGLLPHQHREHGPVRADADHRRRGLLRALRRGLHGADLLLRLAALRGRRDHREEERPGAATRRSRTGRTTSTTSSPSGRSCDEGATMEWIDGNIGSKVTMKYPAIFLMGEHAKGETLSIAFAGEGQHQDAGAKMVHAAPHTRSTIVSKSVARGGGRTRLPRRGPGRTRARTTAPHGPLRRAARRHDQPLGHLPVRRRPRGRRVDGPRGDRLEGQRGPALLPDVAAA